MHDTIADREAYLYNPDRMGLRFRHFETLTLPCIAAQKDPDFTFLIVIGNSLPKLYRDRLYDLTAAIRQIKIVALKPMQQHRAMQQAIRKELGENKTGSIQFRLDDDDAVALSFINSLRWFARQSAPMRKGWKNMAIDYSNGYTFNLSKDGIISEQLQTRFWACGLAMTFQPGDPMTVMNFPHHKLHEIIPTLIHPTPLMYIRAKHDDNDSAEKYKHGLLEPTTFEQRIYFKERFNVDEDHVKEVFSAPALFSDFDWPRDTA